jgi:hypothetical protein
MNPEFIDNRNGNILAEALARVLGATGGLREPNRMDHRIEGANTGSLSS